MNDNEGPIPVSIDDPLWDFRSGGTKLGYVSIINPVTRYSESVFLTRIPTRHSRQGLDQRTVEIVQFMDRETQYKFTWNDIVYKTQSLKDTIQGTFPSVSEAFKNVTENYKDFRSVPIHRKLSLLYDKVSPPYLIYRNEKIGYTENGLVFKLAKHKSYLKEELVDMRGLKVV